jgi:hypothetical protein
MIGGPPPTHFAGGMTVAGGGGGYVGVTHEPAEQRLPVDAVLQLPLQPPQWSSSLSGLTHSSPHLMSGAGHVLLHEPETHASWPWHCVVHEPQ